MGYFHVFASSPLFLSPLRYSEPSSRRVGDHYRRFHLETIQARCHRSGQGVDGGLIRVILFAFRSDLLTLWQRRCGRTYSLIPGVRRKSKASCCSSLGILLTLNHRRRLPLRCYLTPSQFDTCTHGSLFTSTRLPQVSYNHQTLLSQCNMGCSCSTKHWDPVCSTNGLTYASPCLAGCQTSSGMGKEMVR